MKPFVRADGAGELLIWIVVLFVWGLGNLIQRAAGSASQRRRTTGKPTQPQRPQNTPQRPRPAAAPTNATAGSMDPDLQAFLENITGRKLSTQPAATPPPVPKPPAQKPSPRAQPKPQAKQMSPRPGMPRKQTVQPRVGAVTASKTSAMEITDGLPDIVSGTRRRASRTSTSGYLVKTSGIGMPISQLSSAAPRSRRESTWRPDWKNRREFKKAMVSHIVLGKPPALT